MLGVLVEGTFLAMEDFGREWLGSLRRAAVRRPDERANPVMG